MHKAANCIFALALLTSIVAGVGMIMLCCINAWMWLILCIGAFILTEVFLVAVYYILESISIRFRENKIKRVDYHD